MSTEPHTTVPATERAARGSFARILTVMITVLVVVCAGLAVLTLGQGPRLARADIEIGRAHV